MMVFSQDQSLDQKKTDKMNSITVIQNEKRQNQLKRTENIYSFWNWNNWKIKCQNFLGRIFFQTYAAINNKMILFEPLLV